MSIAENKSRTINNQPTSSNKHLIIIIIDFDKNSLCIEQVENAMKRKYL